MKNPPILTSVFLAGILAVACWILPGRGADLGAVMRAAAQQSAPESGQKGESRQDGQVDAALGKLQAARNQLLQHRSVKAVLHEQVEIGARSFHAEGSYLQGTDLRLRLEFHISVGRTEGSLLEVCDGQILFTQHVIGEETRVTRRDVREILSVAAKNSTVPQTVLLGEMGLGGLPALLASLERSMAFDRLTEETVGGQALDVIEGGWTPQSRAAWTGGNPAGELPIFVPDRVRLYFDRQTQFPRRIVYLKQNPETQELRRVVQLDFRDVELNVELPAQAFRFVPPERIVPEDITNAYLERLNPSSANPADAAPSGPTPNLLNSP